MSKRTSLVRWRTIVLAVNFHLDQKCSCVDTRLSKLSTLRALTMYTYYEQFNWHTEAVGCKLSIKLQLKLNKKVKAVVWLTESYSVNDANLSDHYHYLYIRSVYQQPTGRVKVSLPAKETLFN